MSNGAKFFAEVRNLMSIKRFPTIIGHQSETVAEHSYFTALYAAVLSKMEDLDSQSILNVLSHSLVHDLGELGTGDIRSPAKRNISGIEELEAKYRDAFLSLLPKSVRNLLDVGLSEREHRIFKSVDILEALLWAKTESDLGNAFVRKELVKDLAKRLKDQGVRSAIRIAGYAGYRRRL